MREAPNIDDKEALDKLDGLAPFGARIATTGVLGLMAARAQYQAVE